MIALFITLLTIPRKRYSSVIVGFYMIIIFAHFQFEAGHRVQFVDGGRPEVAVEYDWAYEDWHADNPEDKLSQMLLGALSRGNRKNGK